ncbi:hypothetical protein IMZ48_28855 [Candidatus Bathyarchaeota archaeon]|nr:hypothetical protein [Candidatus Bathyarchaeota archaeon]
MAESSHRAKRLTGLEASRPAGLWGIISELLSAGDENHVGTTGGRATR